MKNRIFSIILSVVLSLPIVVWAVDNAEAVDVEPVQAISQLDEDNADAEYKQPISKRKIAKKFFYAMSGVAVSSFAIFFLLTIYNRIRERYSDTKTLDGEVSLESPVDYDSAVKMFLEKTKW